MASRSQHAGVQTAFASTPNALHARSLPEGVRLQMGTISVLQHASIDLVDSGSVPIVHLVTKYQCTWDCKSRHSSQCQTLSCTTEIQKKGLDVIKILTGTGCCVCSWMLAATLGVSWTVLQAVLLFTESAQQPSCFTCMSGLHGECQRYSARDQLLGFEICAVLVHTTAIATFRRSRCQICWTDF